MYGRVERTRLWAAALAAALGAPPLASGVCDSTCCGSCSVSGDACGVDADCPDFATGEVCVEPNGTGTIENANGDQITVDGGQVSLAGATLFVDFFTFPAATNDWIDVDADGFSGFDPLTFPFVDQLARTYQQADLTTWWLFQYRSVGSVRGFEEFVESQTCRAVPRVVPSERGVFNNIEYADAGFITFGGAPDNDSGTPLEPCGVDGSFTDVPASWAVRVDGPPNWDRSPTLPGYGLSPVPSSSGFISNLLPLTRACGTCSGTGEPCTRADNCPGRACRDSALPCQDNGDCNTSVGEPCLAVQTCMPTGEVSSLNTDTDNPDEDTLFDYFAAWVPVVPIANAGTGKENIRFTELQHLLVTGRLPDGENLAGATRDVGSGTRNAYCNTLGVDTSWCRGDNIGDRINSSSQSNLGEGTQPSNCGGSSIVENATQNWRLAIGYTGLAGGSRAAADAQGGRYEILNVCKDVPISGRCGTGSGAECVSSADCAGAEECRAGACMAAGSSRSQCFEAGDCTAPEVCLASAPPCDCDTVGFTRPSVDAVLDNCDPCNSYTVAGAGSFSTVGNRNANRDPLDPAFEAGPRIDNQAVADYLNNIFDSIGSFEGSVQPGECQFSRVCSVGGGNCDLDADCPGFGTGETCGPQPCDTDGDCTDAGTSTCVGGTEDGDDCTATDTDCVLGGGACVPELCRLKLNMPGQILATEFFLPAGLDCLHILNDPLKLIPIDSNADLQEFMRSNSVIDVPPFGSINPAGLVPKRNALSPPEQFSDGSMTGSYAYWDGAGANPSDYFTVISGVNLSARNRIQGDFNGDGARTAGDAAELVTAYYTPRAWQRTAVANGAGPNGGMARDNAIPEVIGDFDGDGDLTKEDLRYFADGLAMVEAVVAGGSSRRLDRKAGAVALDARIQQLGRPFPWADGNDRLLSPPANVGEEPSFPTPADVDDAIAPFLQTGAAYKLGDFRGDVAGSDDGPTAGANPRGWDGRVDSSDIDYVCGNLGSWADLDAAAFLDLSADINGDTALTYDDVLELVEEILVTSLGDVNLDGVVDDDDEAIMTATINAGALGCNGDQRCGWADGDVNCDGVVDATDLGTLNDSDGDGVPDDVDNCVDTPNTDQANFDNDAFGDVCDGDIDGDGVDNGDDVCDFSPVGATVEADGSVVGDLDGDCDVDLADHAIQQSRFTGPNP